MSKWLASYFDHQGIEIFDDIYECKTCVPSSVPCHYLVTYMVPGGEKMSYTANDTELFNSESEAWWKQKVDAEALVGYALKKLAEARKHATEVRRKYKKVRYVEVKAKIEETMSRRRMSNGC
jgi:hypothetical protein